MTSVLRVSDDPFGARWQRSQLRWVTSSGAGAACLAESHAGLTISS